MSKIIPPLLQSHVKDATLELERFGQVKRTVFIFTVDGMESFTLPTFTPREQADFGHFMRECAKVREATALAVVSDCWVLMRPGKSGEAWARAKRVLTVELAPRASEQPDRKEALVVLYFTPEEACMWQQFYEKKGRQIKWGGSHFTDMSGSGESVFDPWLDTRPKGAEADLGPIAKEVGLE